jgi:hypothetical protein
MGLTARRTPRGVVEVRWTRYDGADFSSYVVLRGNQRSVVVRLADQDRLTAVDRTPPAERTPYVVVVLDAAGKVVARSQVVGV